MVLASSSKWVRNLVTYTMTPRNLFIDNKALLIKGYCSYKDSDHYPRKITCNEKALCILCIQTQS